MKRDENDVTSTERSAQSASGRFSFEPARHATNDPDLPGSECTRAAMAKYKTSLGEYTKHVLDTLVECADYGMTGKELWIEAMNSYGAHGIRHMSDAFILRLRHMLREGGVFVENKAGFN